jgi:hypothetical protein
MVNPPLRPLSRRQQNSLRHFCRLSPREIKAMIKTLNFSRVFGLSLAIAASLLASGLLSSVAAQTVPPGRDPFQKPGYARPKVPVAPRIGKDGKPIPIEDYSVPPIESRIDYYKRLRASAAAGGAPLPKVTSVLTLNEMAVIGIFHTPRGYAAMVEATPIKLSYTIYPGEKFFDGQLVAVEENQLVFRKVTRTGKNKFVTTVENMALRKYTDQEQIQGTAPTTQAVASAADSSGNKVTAPAPVVSPLDEMNRQSTAPPEKEKSSDKPAKKPAKVARNK